MKKLLVLTALILFSGIVFSQTLEKGNILAIANLTITLESNITIDEFMDVLVNKFAPDYEKNLPGLKMRILKGVRGEQENSFVLLRFCNSIETWNKYFPDGEASLLVSQGNENMLSTWQQLLARGNWTEDPTVWKVQ